MKLLDGGFSHSGCVHDNTSLYAFVQAFFMSTVSTPESHSHLFNFDALEKREFNLPVAHVSSASSLDVNDLKNRLALGIFTKSDATPENIRLKRYALQNQSAKLLPKERVCNCLKKRIDKSKNVDVMFNKKREKAHYSNIQRCGSIWTCPVCAANISEKRKVEVKKAIDGHMATGGGVYLLTLTVPHYSSTCLNSLLNGLKKATKRFFNGTRATKAMWQKYGKMGHIKALEVTHGNNGWHPHYHIILFLDNPIPDGTNITDLSVEWRNSCRLSNMQMPSMEHGVDLKDASYASQYVSKWGIEHEVTKSHIKQGRVGSLTPWDMLKYSMIEGHPEYSERMAKLFQEFAICFKGKRQLVWSRGLKALYAIDEKTDEELAEETEQESNHVMDIELFLWTLIKRHYKRSDFLSLVEYDQKHQTNTAIEFLITLSEKAVIDMRTAS